MGEKAYPGDGAALVATATSRKRLDMCIVWEHGHPVEYVDLDLLVLPGGRMLMEVAHDGECRDDDTVLVNLLDARDNQVIARWPRT